MLLILTLKTVTGTLKKNVEDEEIVVERKMQRQCKREQERAREERVKEREHRLEREKCHMIGVLILVHIYIVAFNSSLHSPGESISWILEKKNKKERMKRKNKIWKRERKNVEGKYCKACNWQGMLSRQ